MDNNEIKITREVISKANELSMGLNPKDVKLQEEANKVQAEMTQSEIPKGAVVVGYTLIDGTNYIRLRTNTGHEVDVHRVQLLQRVNAVKDMYLNENGAGDPEDVDRAITTAKMLFEAVIASAHANKKEYPLKAKQDFWKALLYIERTWRKKPFWKTKSTSHRSRD